MSTSKRTHLAFRLTRHGYSRSDTSITTPKLGLASPASNLKATLRRSARSVSPKKHVPKPPVDPVFARLYPPGWTKDPVCLTGYTKSVIWEDFGLDPSKVKVVLADKQGAFVMEQSDTFYLVYPAAEIVFAVEEPLDLDTLLLELCRPDPSKRLIRLRAMELLVDSDVD